MSQCTYFENIQPTVVYKCRALVFLSSTLYVLCIEAKKKFCKPEQREDNPYNLPMWQRKVSYELTFWFISIENGGKQKSKNALKVEIS